MFGEWLTTDHDLKQMESRQFFADFEAFRETYSATGNRLLHNFLKLANLVSAKSSSAVEFQEDKCQSCG